MDSIASSSGTSSALTLASVVHGITSSSITSSSSTPALTSIIHSTSSTETKTEMPGKAVVESSPSIPSLTTPSTTAPPATSSPSGVPPIQNSNESSDSPALFNSSGTYTVQSVTVVILVPTSTEITTVSPAATFSTPVAVTWEEAGVTSVGTPPLVTVLSTNTYSNGSVATWTQVYANPTADTVVRSNSFLQNTGAVAGVFAVIGIIAACILLCMLYFIRRIYRRKRQSRWHMTLQSMRPEHESDYKAPFYDQNMHSPSNNPSSPVDGSRKAHHGTPPSYLPRVFSGIKITTESRRWSPETEGSYSDDYRRNSIATQSHRTSTPQTNPFGIDNITPQSTPSIYPTTLPPMDSEIELDVEIPVEQPAKWTEQEVLEERRVEQPAERNGAKPQITLVARARPRTADSVLDTKPQAAYAASDRPRTADSAPPRPPKSVLRSRNHSLRTDGAGENSSSISSGSPLDPMSHQALHAILKRQTLLDVRPRSSFADVGSAR